jgi:NAD(P)-dependent dehydrogenase (short-subunit alcohol dehydrogenase family)
MADKAGWPASATLRDQANTPSSSQPKRRLGLVRCSRRRPRARIVNVASREASLTDLGHGMPGYHVSTVALNALTRALAAELRDECILVDAVSPSWTATDMRVSGGRPVADGAASILCGATLDDGPTGGFFQDDQHLPR